MKLLNAMATVAGYSLISRVTGMVRDMAIAAFLGAGPLADAFFVALRLPNMFRRIAAEGAFSVSFIPMYSKDLQNDGEKDAAEFAGTTFSVMTILLAIFTILMMLAMPVIIRIIAPGFEPGQGRYWPAVDMTRITFPYLLLMSLTSLFGGMLNAHNKFGPFAAAPILFNLCALVAIFIGTQFFADHNIGVAYSMAWGITISGLLQLGLMVVFIRRHKIAFNIRAPKFDGKIKRLFKLMGPGIIGAGLLQINIFIDTLFASLLATGAISYLYYADRLQQLPLGVIGIAVGTALLPLLSRSIASGNTDESRDLFNRSLEYTYLIALPAAVALLIVPIPIIALLFERGEFAVADTISTSYVLMGYAVGLPAYIAGKVFASIFWARHDTVTPVKVSLWTSALNIVLCICFIKPFGIAGIALATGLSGWLQLILYSRKLQGVEIAQYDAQFKDAFPKIAISCCAMAVVLAVLNYLLQPWFHDHSVHKLVAVLGLLAAGGLTYIVMVLSLGVIKLKELKIFF